MSALKRILNKDMKSIQEQNLKNLGIYIEFNEENLYCAKALIVGPEGTLYEGGYLLFNIKFPKNYPYAPPDISYVSRNRVRIHPNLYVGHHSSGFGKICLSILGTWSGPKWTTIMDITTVLLSIQSLLDNNPLHHEPGQEKNTTKVNDYYNEVIEYESINTLLIKNMFDTPNDFECFKDIMIENFKKNEKMFLQKIKKRSEKPHTLLIPLYRINLHVDYGDVLYRFNYLKKTLKI